MSDSSFVRKEPCPACGSRDNLGRFDDGHGYCFGCGHFESGNDNDTLTYQPRKSKMTNSEFVSGEHKQLNARGISEETAKKFDYTIGSFSGKPVQIANYRDKFGELIAQKIRFKNKDFTTRGDMKSVRLYGEHIWKGEGRRAVVTEGEIDAMSVSQAQGNKWPVYSVPTGASGAARSFRKSIDLLSQYDEVVICFDSDEPGQKAAKECAQMLPPGKALIAKLPMKDANEMLVSGKTAELIDALWQAKPYRPDGIISGTEMWDLVSTEDSTVSCPYPFEGLNNKTMGLRRGEIVTITAGSGIGKSQVCREIAYSLLNQGETIGYIALEENNKRTALGFMGLYLNKPVHLGNQDVTPEEFREAFDNTLNTGRIYLYDHWGSMEVDNLLNKIRYMVTGCECNWIVLDHISIVVSGMENGDERRTIDNLMTRLRGLVEEVNCGLIMVSHLKRPSGNKGHEDGVQTSMAQLRGSAGIGQLSDMVIGCERDQQGENPDRTTVRVLKNRWTGETGEACYLDYDKKTGRMVEVQGAIDFDEGVDDDTIPFELDKVGDDF